VDGLIPSLIQNGEHSMKIDETNRPGRKKTGQPVLEISTLQRREIQSPLVAGLIRAFISELGHDKAMDVASAAIQKDAMEVGKMMAERYGGNSMKELVHLVREGWAEDDALELTFLEETDQRLGFDVTRCRYAELYDRLKIKEFGYCLSCNRDAPLIKSFNPRMKLLRTQTIMQGARICDFRIILE
jgi:hypothetical protein